MKKKVTALVLVVVLLAAAVVGGTLAYFTDTDEAENVFTVGDVKIAIREEDDKGNPYDDSTRLVPGGSATRVPKFVYIDNVGSNPAYVRATFIMPLQWEGLLLQFVGSWANDWSLPDGTKNVNNFRNQLYTIDGVDYYGITLYADEPVQPGTCVGNQRILSYVALDSTFDWVDKENHTSYSLGTAASGRKVTIPVADPDLPMEVMVIAEAIQAENFDNVWDAFEAFDTQKGA